MLHAFIKKINKHKHEEKKNHLESHDLLINTINLLVSFLIHFISQWIFTYVQIL